MTRSGNFIFTHFDGISRFDCSQYALKTIFLKKFLRYMLQTFQKCSSDHYLQLFQRWYGDFRILTAVKSKKLLFLIKLNHFFLIFLRNTLDTGFKLCGNVHWIIVYNFCKDCIVIFAYRLSFQQFLQCLFLFRPF